MDKKAIIIGGGLGGLTTAALLCKEGYNVVVLEKHYSIGGGLHTFRRDGLEYETGMHYISGFEEGGVLRKLYTYLEVFDKLKIKPLDTDAFDIVKVDQDKLNFKVGIGKENFIKHWSDAFPEESDNIRAYTDAIFQIADVFYLCNMRKPDALSSSMMDDEEITMPVGRFIEKYIKNPHLRDLLAWCSALYGGEKDHTPVYIHAIINRQFISGASRFVGSSKQLSDLLCNMIESYGGKVIARDGVVKINSENRHATSVVTESGKIYDGDFFVSSIHPAVLMNMVDESQFTKAYRNRMLTVPNTYSAFVLYAKMKEGQFPYINSNVYCVDRYEDIWNISSYTWDRWPLGMMLMTPASECGDEKFSNRVVVNCIMNFSDVSKWKNTITMHRGEEYERFKQVCQEKVLDKIEKYFPDFRNKMESCFSATPLTIRDYTGSIDGSLYGFKKDSDNMILAHISPCTKIDNLFITGQNINLHGMLGVPLNAMTTVAAMTGGIEHLIDKIQASLK